MTLTENMPQSIVVVHPTMLLAQPTLGAPALGFLAEYAHLQSKGCADGFFQVHDSQGRPGYLPAAICQPQAIEAPDGKHPTIRLVQPVTPYSNPSPGGQTGQNWIIPAEEPVQVMGQHGRFLKVQRTNGQSGYVPELLAKKPISSHGMVSLIQPVSLYYSPAPGGQFVQMVASDEPLLLLGKDERFALVQREDGQLCYVPAILCGEMSPEMIFKVGPLDLGWVFLGGGWTLFNWGAVVGLIARSNLVEPFWKPYLALGILLGTAATLWLGSRRRMLARSFAIGMLLCYAFLHLGSGGRFTLWP